MHALLDSTGSPWPASASALDRSWLSRVLEPRNHGHELEGFERVRVGTGQVGECWRLSLRYRHDSLVEGAAPIESGVSCGEESHGEEIFGPSEAKCLSESASPVRSVVAKFAATEASSRAAGVSQSCYLREVGFYTDVAATLSVRTAECYFAAIADDHSDHVLILEDLAPAKQGDQIAGCSLAEAEAALVQLARLHGSRWGDTTLSDLAWLEGPTYEAWARGIGLFRSVAGGFVDRYRDRLTSAGVAIVEWLDSQAVWSPTESPLTLVHNDYRVDNLLFRPAPCGQALEVTVVDWQTVKLGRGPSDAAYFLGGGLPIALRRAHERELLADVYYAGLESCGVEGYSFDQCWLDYRRGAFGGVIMAVIASMLVASTERGDEMFLTMTRRHAEHALDVDAMSAV